MPKKGRAFLFQMEAEDEAIVKSAMEEHHKKMLIGTDMTNAIRMMIRFWAKWHDEVGKIEAERTLRKGIKSLN